MNTNKSLIAPNSDPDDSRPLTGKIARLPDAIREQLNQRLFDGQSGAKILPWLNDLPVVKEILAAQFAGTSITKQNISQWRHGGYRRWLQQKQNLNSIKELGKYAADLTASADGRLAPAAAALASGKLMKFLDAAESAKNDSNDIAKCAAAAAILNKTEQNNVRIGIAKERLRQREMLIFLKRDKLQRDTTAVALRVLGDARAKEIEAASIGHAEKIEILGTHLYGPLWEPRPVTGPK